MPTSDPKTESALGARRQTALLIERLAAVLLFATLFIGVVLVLQPFLTAFLFGGILVIATWPLHEWLIRRGLSNTFATVVLSLLAIACLIVPVLALAPQMSTRLVELVHRGQTLMANPPDLPNWLIGLPFIGGKIEQLWSGVAHGRLAELVSPYSATIRKTAFDFGSAVLAAVLQIVLSLAVAAMFWLRGTMLKQTFFELGERFGGEVGKTALDTAVSSVRGVAYGIVGTAAAQAIVLTVGLFVAGIPGAGFLGFVALVIALSQIGVLLVVVWGGAAWSLFSAGEPGWAIFMLVWGLAVSTLDNVIRPLLMRVGAPIPLTLIFLGVFGGFVAFGFLGMFIGPTLLAVFLALLQAWRKTSAAAE